MTDAYRLFLEKVHAAPPRVAFILGSGLGDVGVRLTRAERIAFLQVPGLETEASVIGHRGDLLLGDWAGQRVLLFQGRLHYYEGYPWRRVVAPAHIAKDLGAQILFVTNAAGGIHDVLQPGAVMAILDHLDWTRPDWWREDSRSEGRCPYSTRLLEKLTEAGRDVGRPIMAGVYAQLTGPCYETPAEIRALKVCGADAVGMSTAREVKAGHELGLECVGMSLITNRAAGLSGGTLHHEEVLTTAAAQQQSLADLLERFLNLLNDGRR